MYYSEAASGISKMTLCPTLKDAQSQQNWWNSDRNNATVSQSHLPIYPPQIFSKLYTLQGKRKGRITKQTVTQGD